MDVILYGWPWFALIAGAVLSLALVLGPRPAGAPPRLRDPKWLLQIGLPIYMLHQFEEHVACGPALLPTLVGELRAARIEAP